MQNAIRHGICKLNIYADCRIAMRRGLENAYQGMRRVDPLPYEIFGPIRKEVAAVVQEKIDLMFAANRVNV